MPSEVDRRIQSRPAPLNQGSRRTDKLIAASVQWAELIMKNVDSVLREGVSVTEPFTS